ITVNNTWGEVFNGILTTNLLEDGTDRAVLDAPVSASVSIPPGENTNVQLTATLASPKLWHFDHPNLYRWSAS
ncbi:MAG: hypothetical protein NTV38_04710, partial [Chloroflexi bacterium]|nr:hypothetical protein [Chloroflexota bacterium]